MGTIKSPEMEPQGQVADTAVRLVCRYSNGLTQNLVSRGVSMNKGVLRVSVREQFEVGVSLTVMSAFLPRITPAQVVHVERGPEPGAFLLDLKLLSKPIP